MISTHSPATSLIPFPIFTDTPEYFVLVLSNLPSYILRPEDYQNQSLPYKPAFVEKYIYLTSLLMMYVWRTRLNRRKTKINNRTNLRLPPVLE